MRRIINYGLASLVLASALGLTTAAHAARSQPSGMGGKSPRPSPLCYDGDTPRPPNRAVEQCFRGCVEDADPDAWASYQICEGGRSECGRILDALCPQVWKVFAQLAQKCNSKCCQDPNKRRRKPSKGKRGHRRPVKEDSSISPPTDTRETDSNSSLSPPENFQETPQPDGAVSN